MKNTTNASLMRLFGIIAIAAIIAFSFAACGGGGGGGVNVNARFRNAAPPANVSQTGLSVMGGTTEETGTYSAITAYYSGIGQLQSTAITPTSFQVWGGGITAYVGSTAYGLTNDDGRLINFMDATVLNMPDDIPVGINVTGMFVGYTWTDPPGKNYPTTTFTVAGGLADGHPWKGMTDSKGHTYANTGTTITVPTYLLLPAPDQVIDPKFLYTGTVYKWEDTFALIGLFQGFVTPWAGMSTSGLSSVTLNVNWNMNGIIQQYGTGATARFVLADKFWERLSLTIN